MPEEYPMETTRLHPLAGKPVPPEQLIDVGRLEQEYYRRRTDPDDPSQRVSFGR